MIDRLEKAKEGVEKAFNNDKADDMGKMAKRFKNLYFECIQKGEGTKEYHYAECIKKVIMLYFENILNGYGDAETLSEECEYEAQLAGINLNIIVEY
jgi:hypothetical protein